jgi:ABC-type transport system involved in cytochrome c biogenesis ATPase subunit
MIDAHARAGGAVIVATHEHLGLSVAHRFVKLGTAA